jgi:hypothetical protein
MEIPREVPRDLVALDYHLMSQALEAEKGAV